MDELKAWIYKSNEGVFVTFAKSKEEAKVFLVRGGCPDSTDDIIEWIEDCPIREGKTHYIDNFE
jgi:hypothetical protein